MNRILAIITARGGSKRIPRKNIKDFIGKPIIAYSIEAALASGIFEEVMVSTDDQEIADVALKYGASVPFLRSQTNSDDYSTTADVIVEVLHSYKEIEREFDFACCIYPTAPFVTADKLKLASSKLIDSGAKTLVPVVAFSFPILRSFKLNEDGNLEMNWPEYRLTRSQDLPNAYHDAGQFYFFETKSFQSLPSLYTDFTIPYEMPESEVQDIDNEEDWKIAEIKYSFLINKKNS